MRPKWIMLLFIFLSYLIPGISAAQLKETKKVGQLWAGYFNQSRLSEDWGLWMEVQLRTRKDFFTNFSQVLLRAGLTRYISNEAKLTVGYAFINHFPSDDHPGISQPEHRGWQQLQWHSNFSNLRLMQWFRLEERWRRKILNGTELDDGYHFNFRVRYNFFSQIPLSHRKFQPNTVSFVVNDEIHINFGKEVINNYFDQNRLFLGFNYHINRHDTFQFGYMNAFQQLAAGYKYRTTHAVRLFYFQNLDFRKKHDEDNHVTANQF